MRIEKLVFVSIYLHLGVVCSPAQIKQEETKENSVSRAIDISHDLERRLEKWKKHGLLSILICPQVISPDDDPLALPGQKKTLSVLGFGKLEKKDADALVSFIGEKEFSVPKLTGGFHAELYFLCSESKFSSLDRLTCYISNGSVDLKFSDEKGNFVWVGLSDKCGKLIEDNFARSSMME